MIELFDVFDVLFVVSFSWLALGDLGDERGDKFKMT
jgi:hypothetical protein